jgi:MFS family permease
MNSGQQGLLGGVAYLSLGVASPFAGYFLRHYNHKLVLGCAVTGNMFFAFLWALTPVGLTYSTSLFILLRFLMGICQCIICVFLPLWTNENAPKTNKTIWMSYLQVVSYCFVSSWFLSMFYVSSILFFCFQASVPLGVMVGYIIAAVSLSFSESSLYCAGLLCWRWPILIEVFLLFPLYVGLYFVPSEHIEVQIHKLTREPRVSDAEPPFSRDDILHNQLEIGEQNQCLITPVRLEATETTPLIVDRDSSIQRSYEMVPTPSKVAPHLLPLSLLTLCLDKTKYDRPRNGEEAT